MMNSVWLPKARATLAIALSIALSCARCATSIDVPPIPFETGKAETTQPANSALDGAASLLKQNPTVQVSVAGYTDTNECAGNDCFKLSQQRARFVSDWLTAHGVERAQINSVTGMGAGFPVDRNDTDEGRAKNRRVDISWVESEK